MSSVQIQQKTKKRLAKFGYKLDSWDKILNSLMDHANVCDLFWLRKDEEDEL